MTPILGIMASGMSGNLWAPGKDYDSIATVTVSTAVSSISFTSIPATYKHLQLRILGRGTNPNTECQFVYQFNGDTGSNYTFHLLRGSGAAAFADAGTSQTFTQATVRYAAGTAAANMFGAGISDILDYSNTNKYKTVRSIGGTDQNGSGNLYYSSNLWLNTAAISSILVFNQDGNNLAQYSSFALYGIK